MRSILERFTSIMYRFLCLAVVLNLWTTVGQSIVRVYLPVSANPNRNEPHFIVRDYNPYTDSISYGVTAGRNTRPTLMKEFVRHLKKYKIKKNFAKIRPVYSEPEKILERDQELEFERTGFVVAYSDLSGEILGVLRFHAGSFIPLLTKTRRETVANPAEKAFGLEEIGGTELSITTEVMPNRATYAWMMWKTFIKVVHASHAIYNSFIGVDSNVVFFGDRVSKVFYDRYPFQVVETIDAGRRYLWDPFTDHSKQFPPDLEPEKYEDLVEFGERLETRRDKINLAIPFYRLAKQFRELAEYDNAFYYINLAIKADPFSIDIIQEYYLSAICMSLFQDESEANELFVQMVETTGSIIDAPIMSEDPNTRQLIRATKEKLRELQFQASQIIANFSR